MKLTIISRENWKARKSKVVYTPNHPKIIIIHHEGAGNPKQKVASSFKGIKTIQAIQNFHMDEPSRGWCFSLDTEIFTNNGWKDYNELNENDLVYTVENGFTKDYKKVFFVDTPTVLLKTLNYSGDFTLNHKLYCCNTSSDNFERKTVESVLKNTKSYLKILTSINSTKFQKSYDPNYCKLLSVIVSDGSFNKHKNYNLIEISLKKERKINYLFKLLNELKIDYTVQTHKIKKGYLVFHITQKSFLNDIKKDIFINNEKKLGWHLIQLNEESRKAIIEGYINSDGCPNTGEGKSYRFVCSSVKQNMDVLQAMCHLSGLRTKLTEPKHSGKQIKQLYTLSINDRNNVIVDLRRKDFTPFIQDTWSVDCGGKLIMIRHKGCVQITSNSDIAYSAIIAPNGDIYQGRPFDAVGAHTKGHNTGSIGICIIGNFEVEVPTEEQLKSLKNLIIHLTTLFPVLDVPKCLFGHKDFANTDCPGKNLYPIIFDWKTGKNKFFTI